MLIILVSLSLKIPKLLFLSQFLRNKRHTLLILDTKMYLHPQKYGPCTCKSVDVDADADTD